MRLKLGLIGLSDDWNQRHLPALRMLTERFEVRGIYSPVSSRGENVAREFDAEQFGGYREMLRSDEIDAVLVLESSWHGTSPVLAACDYGKAIYCGSDIAIDPDEALALKDTVTRSGVAFMAEFPRRYTAASLRLKELIATRLGAPKLIFCHRRLGPRPKASAGRNGRSERERTDRELVELIDWSCFMAGKPVRKIQGICHESPETNTLDYQALSLELSDDASPTDHENSISKRTIAQISCGAYIPSEWEEAVNFRPPAAMQVRCEHGVAFLDLPNSLIWFDEAGRHQESLESELAVGHQLLSQFHRAVTSLVRKTSDLDDVCRALCALQTARKSYEQGQVLGVS